MEHEVDYMEHQGWGVESKFHLGRRETNDKREAEQRVGTLSALSLVLGCGLSQLSRQGGNKSLDLGTTMTSPPKVLLRFLLAHGRFQGLLSPQSPLRRKTQGSCPHSVPSPHRAVTTPRTQSQTKSQVTAENGVRGICHLSLGRGGERMPLSQPVFGFWKSDYWSFPRFIWKPLLTLFIQSKDE